MGNCPVWVVLSDDGLVVEWYFSEGIARKRAGEMGLAVKEAKFCEVECVQ